MTKEEKGMGIVKGVEEEWSYWCCPKCGRTVGAPKIGYYRPNIICECKFPQSVTQMQLVK